MSDFNVRVDDAQPRAAFNALPRHIFNAQRSAIRGATTYGRRNLEKRLATNTGIKQTTLKKYRVKRRVSDRIGVVWVGYNPIKAAYVGKLEQIDTGAFAGKYYFKGGFVARMLSGHRSIFKRTGRFKEVMGKRGKSISKEIIAEQAVELPNVLHEAQAVADLTGKEFRRLFNTRLESYMSGGRA